MTSRALHPADVALQLVELSAETDIEGNRHRADLLLAGAALSASCAVARTAPDRAAAIERLGPVALQLREGLRSFGQRLGEAAAGALRAALAEMDATAPGPVPARAGRSVDPASPALFTPGSKPQEHPGWRPRGERVLLAVTYSLIAGLGGVTVAAVKQASARRQVDVTDLRSIVAWADAALLRAVGRAEAQAEPVAEIPEHPGHELVTVTSCAPTEGWRTPLEPDAPALVQPSAGRPAPSKAPAEDASRQSVRRSLW